MAKYMSPKEKRLQKLLIPVNLIVCIISVVAALSLFFMPVLKIDIGKILSSEQVMQFVEEQADTAVGSDIGQENNTEVDFTPVVGTIVKNVFSSMEGSISVTTFSALKVLMADNSDKAQIVKEELITGEGGFLETLISSLVDGVIGLFDDDGVGKDIIEKVLVSAIANSLLGEFAPESGKLTESQLSALTDKFKELNNVSGRDQAAEVINEFIDKLGEFVPDANIDENRGELADYILEMYGETLDVLAEKGEADFSLEAFICVNVSKTVNLSDFDIGKIFEDIFGGEKSDVSEEGAVAAAYATAEDGAEDRVVCTTYSELLEAMGLNAEEKQTLKENLFNTLSDAFDKTTAQYDKYLGYYGYFFYVMLVFIALWALLFLFSFFHILAKNKRFSMWYVKLLCWIPCVVFFVAPLAAKTLLPRFLPQIFSGEEGPLIYAVLGGISSSTWISGACYVLLWIVSVFWAFPIKRKIRKERKNPTAPATASGNSGYSSDYGSNYGSDYGSGYCGSYGNDYGSGYGGSYGNDYGSDYGSNYGSGYGSDYGSGYGSGFGSSYDDDDDDDLFGSSYGSGVGSYSSYGLDDDDDDDY